MLSSCGLTAVFLTFSAMSCNVLRGGHSTARPSPWGLQKQLSGLGSWAVCWSGLVTGSTASYALQSKIFFFFLWSSVLFAYKWLLRNEYLCLKRPDCLFVYLSRVKLSVFLSNDTLFHAYHCISWNCLVSTTHCSLKWVFYTLLYIAGIMVYSSA